MRINSNNVAIISIFAEEGVRGTLLSKHVASLRMKMQNVVGSIRYISPFESRAVALYKYSSVREFRYHGRMVSVEISVVFSESVALYLA